MGFSYRFSLFACVICHFLAFSSVFGMGKPIGSLPATSQTKSDAFRVIFATLNENGDPASQFKSGKDISFLLAIRNISDQPQKFYVTGPLASFTVYRDNKPIGNTMDGVVYTQVIREGVLQSMEIKKFQTSWLQGDGIHEPLPPGTYHASATVRAHFEGKGVSDPDDIFFVVIK